MYTVRRTLIVYISPFQQAPKTAEYQRSLEETAKEAEKAETERIKARLERRLPSAERVVEEVSSGNAMHAAILKNITQHVII